MTKAERIYLSGRPLEEAARLGATSPTTLWRRLHHKGLIRSRAQDEKALAWAACLYLSGMGLPAVSAATGKTTVTLWRYFTDEGIMRTRPHRSGI